MSDEADRIADARGGKGHVAVIYFHGMGSQRRFEETCRLVDRFDTLMEVAARRGDPLGKLRGIRARAEPGLAPGQPDITYLRVLRVQKPGAPVGTENDLRFYEAYWADEMTEERSSWGVIKWLLRQIWRPVTMLWTPWRERQRLRRAFLIELLEDRDAWPKGTMETDFEALRQLYSEYDHPRWLRHEDLAGGKGRRQGGDFAGFLTLIAAKNAGKPDRTARLTALARAWRSRYLRHEVGSFIVLLSLMLTILLVVFLLAAGVLGLLVNLPQLLAWLGITNQVPLPDWAAPNWPNAAALAVGALLALGLRSFLVRRLADVEAWSTFAETDEKFRKRQAVLRKSRELLCHVVSHPGCERVVVVGHSLGTSVAYDTLLEAVHANRAVNPQEPMTGRVDFNRISHFVTIASPIDKIAYFFESFRTPVRRYRKVYDELRGDIGTAPFTRSGGQPKIHWLNIWDRADIISGPLQSPAAAFGASARIDNLHVNTLAWFNPGAAHGAYFDHYGVIRLLFDILFEDRGHYSAAQLGFVQDAEGRRRGLDYRGADFGPGTDRGRWSLALAACVAAPWAWLAWLVALLSGAPALATICLGLSLLLSAVPVAAMLPRLLRRAGSADPLQ